MILVITIHCKPMKMESFINTKEWKVWTPKDSVHIIYYGILTQEPLNINKRAVMEIRTVPVTGMLHCIAMIKAHNYLRSVII